MTRKVRSILPGDDQHILAGDDLVAMSTETFSEKPLYSVTDNRIAYLRTNGYAKPGLSSLVRFGYNQEMGAVELLPPTRQAEKLWPFSQTGLLRKVRLATRQHPPFFYVRARFGGTLTVSLLRPLALRLFSTLRPPGVSIRVRKPWVRLRRTLLG
jgi:hypothetical protein